VQQATGLETILHFTTRDRNRMAIQADLLSAHALGIRNVLALTGDPPALGDQPAQGVFELDSVGLLGVLQRLNRGEDAAGHPLGTPTRFVAGCAFNPNAEDLGRELERLRQKLDAGAAFIMTQPLYERRRLEEALERAGPLEVPVLLGVMPLHSLKHAVYLNREVPGVYVPEEVLARLERAGQGALAAGLELAEEMVVWARPAIAGVYIVLSFGKVAPILDLVRTLHQRFGPREPAGRRAGAEPSPSTAD
jgi:5,10-methylenetetrahydrofolate reductase